jgi:recombinational DNA repair ATPase RecF
MLVRKLALQNVRSFLDRAELSLDGPITIVIGPNGGGKTNLSEWQPLSNADVQRVAHQVEQRCPA